MLMTRRKRLLTVHSMERAEAIERLPATHAAVIRLLDAGADEQTVADHLGIHLTAVAPLVKVAQAKLVRLLGAADVEGKDNGNGNGP
jgi:hypothetical protein